MEDEMGLEKVGRHGIFCLQSTFTTGVATTLILPPFCILAGTVSFEKDINFKSVQKMCWVSTLLVLGAQQTETFHYHH